MASNTAESGLMVATPLVGLGLQDLRDGSHVHPPIV